jgi:hypothetical protein
MTELERLALERARIANGYMLRMLNIGSGYKQVLPLQSTAKNYKGINEAECYEAVKYLFEAGYLFVRVIGEKNQIEDFADVVFERLEARPNPNGDRVLKGVKIDELIEV